MKPWLPRRGLARPQPVVTAALIDRQRRLAHDMRNAAIRRAFGRGTRWLARCPLMLLRSVLPAGVGTRIVMRASTPPTAR